MYCRQAFRMERFVRISRRGKEPHRLPLNNQGQLPMVQLKAIDSRISGLIYRLQDDGYVYLVVDENIVQLNCLSCIIAPAK